MTITEKDKAKARDYERQLEVMQGQMKNMRVWFSTLASSTEPGEVEQESIDLGENNPEKRPEWWRELSEGEEIQKVDIVMYLGRFEFTVLEGEHYRPLVPGRKRHNPPHYRLRPWRDMEDGEMYQGGDEYYHRKQNVWKRCERAGYQLKGNRYRTRRPKPVELPEEPELKLPDGTDISGWPVIEAGEMVYPGDAYLNADKWVEYPVTRGARIVQRGCLPHRRRVLPCRHCGGKAYWSRDKYWYCYDCGCRGPFYDESAVKWNEQNRTSVERSEKEQV